METRTTLSAMIADNLETVNAVLIKYRNKVYAPFNRCGAHAMILDEKEGLSWQQLERLETCVNFSLNIHALGYYMEPKDLVLLMNILGLGVYEKALDGIFKALQKAKGADKKYQFFFGDNGFAEDVELAGKDPYFYAVMSYISNGALNGNLEPIDFNPETVIDQSVAAPENIDFTKDEWKKVSDAISEAFGTIKDGWEKISITLTTKDFFDIFTNLLKSNVPLSDSMKEDLCVYLDYFYPTDYHNYAKGKTIPVNCKETLAFLMNELLKREYPYKWLTKNINNATDVLRMYATYSGSDGALIEHPKFKDHLSAYERRFFLDLLMECPNLESDICRYPEYWKRAFERLKPHKFGKKNYKPIADVYRRLALGGKKKPRSLNSKIWRVIEHAGDSLQSFEQGLTYLENFPGIYLRNIDKYVRSYGDKLDDDMVENRHLMKVVCSSLNRVVPNVQSTKLVLDMMCYYAQKIYLEKENKMNLRYVKPRGQRRYFALPPVSENICNKEYLLVFYHQIYRILYLELLSRFRKLPYLGNVYIDPLACGCVVPTELREENDTGAKILGRGSVFQLGMEHDEKFQEVYIPYIHWANYLDKNGHEVRVDIDLSVNFLDEKLQNKKHLYYCDMNVFHDDKIVATHSGDYTDGGTPKGAGVAEAVYIRRDDCLNAGYRYAVINIHCYTGDVFKEVGNTFFGFQYMLEDRENRKIEVLNAHREEGRYLKRDIINPERTLITSNIASNETAITLALIDLQTRQLYWVDSNVSVPKHVSDELYDENLKLHFANKKAFTDFRSLINSGGNNCLATELNALTQVKAILNKPRLYCLDLLGLHMDARGSRATTPAEADIIFTMPGSEYEKNAREDQEILTPFMVDRWLSEFLPIEED